MRAGIWFDATLVYDTPLMVNVCASLEATLSMVPAVNRHTFAGPFNTVGNVIGFGLLHVVPALLAADFIVADAEWKWPMAMA
jgi:hypothetical protein